MGVNILLKKLGVPRDVQLLFAPYFKVDKQGNLLFAYGDEWEHFSLAFHRVPTAIHPWQAGNPLATQVIICSSAMEAIAFLSLNAHRLPIENPLFISVGCLLQRGHLLGIKKAALVFGRDILGRLLDIHVAALLAGQDVRLKYEDGQYVISWRNRAYEFEESKLSLSAFERASGFRSACRTYKAKGFNSFLEQLKNGK